VPPSQLAAPPALEDLLPLLVRKVAWSRVGERGAVRLELGAGALAGAVLLIETDEEGRVRVRLDAPAGVDSEAWRARLYERLSLRGLKVEVD